MKLHIQRRSKDHYGRINWGRDWECYPYTGGFTAGSIPTVQQQAHNDLGFRVLWVVA